MSPRWSGGRSRRSSARRPTTGSFSVYSVDRQPPPGGGGPRASRVAHRVRPAPRLSRAGRPVRVRPIVRTRTGSRSCSAGRSPTVGEDFLPALVTFEPAPEGSGGPRPRRGRGGAALRGHRVGAPLHGASIAGGRAPGRSRPDVLAPGDLIRVHRAGGDRWELAQVPVGPGRPRRHGPRTTGPFSRWPAGSTIHRSKFNRGTQARRQPGSSFKPFIYASALARGFTAASLINDAPVVFDDPARSKPSGGPRTTAGSSSGRPACARRSSSRATWSPYGCCARSGWTTRSTTSNASASIGTGCRTASPSPSGAARSPPSSRPPPIRCSPTAGIAVNSVVRRSD